MTRSRQRETSRISLGGRQVLVAREPARDKGFIVTVEEQDASIAVWRKMGDKWFGTVAEAQAAYVETMQTLIAEMATGDLPTSYPRPSSVVAIGSVEED